LTFENSIYSWCPLLDEASIKRIETFFFFGGSPDFGFFYLVRTLVSASTSFSFSNYSSSSFGNL